MKLGKTEATLDGRDLAFHDFAAEPLKEAPVGFGHWPSVAKVGLPWGTLGNDRYGDCVWAGAAHETMLWNAENKRPVPFTDQGVLADYAAVTGFDPITGAGDNGTNVRQALNYRRSRGVAAADGSRHRIGAYVALEPGDFGQLLEALWCFDAVAIGFQVPESAMQQFQDGKAWSYIGDGTIVGGHYVPIVGRCSTRGLYAVSWGRTQKMTRRFFEVYTDEAYGIVSPDALSAAGKTPEGLDLDALNAALAEL